MKIILNALIMLFTCTVITAQTINKIEYFIDVDKGVGKNKIINVDAASDTSFHFTAETNNLSPGYHSLYIRTKDNKGNWSISAIQTIQIFKTDEDNEITHGEYFFDVDKGFGKNKKISISNKDSAILQNFTASVTELKPGYHTLYTRMLDTYGNWSQTDMYNVQVTRDADTEYIVKVEYFFITDAGVGKCSSIVFATPLDNGSFSFNIPKNTIPSNAKKLYVRVKDSSNNDWSITRFTGINNTIVASNSVENSLDLKATSFLITPNPAQSFFNISFINWNKQSNVHLSVKDMHGNVVISKDVSSTSLQKINVSQLAKGIYYVTITATGYTSTKPVIVQ